MQGACARGQARKPLEAAINVFSDSLSENDRKSQNERVHKFHSSELIFAGTVISIPS